jgi:hypothetical protein
MGGAPDRGAGDLQARPQDTPEAGQRLPFASPSECVSGRSSTKPGLQGDLPVPVRTLHAEVPSVLLPRSLRESL